jgi:hypothetical protein
MYLATIHDRRFIRVIYRHIQYTKTIVLNMAQDFG